MLKRRRTKGYTVWTQDEQKTIFDLRKAGATMAQVYAIFPNRSPATVREKMFRMGLSVAENKNTGENNVPIHR